MTDFLLELLSEEIPARMQVKAKADLERLFTDALARAGLAATAVETFATPRRLALIARGLPLATEAVREETKGPKLGAPPQALEGFLRKTGLSEDQLVARDGVYFAVIDKPGRATADVLAEAVPAIVRAFPWPKSMRWGAASRSTESLRWVRPLQGIVALLGDDVVPLTIAGIASGRTTLGHRFLSHGPVSIANADAYVEALRAAHVVVHFSERCALIRDGAVKAAAAAGLRMVDDEALVVENAGLTEWPVPLLGRFDPAFLEVPPEVIQLTARVNQKYFVCKKPLPFRGGVGVGDVPASAAMKTSPTPNPSPEGEGDLADAFICTANIAPSDGGAAIVDGNRKVLAARLSDARFFWEQDQKKTLAEHAEKLRHIVFHEKLGTVADKVDRVAKLARWLCEEGIVKPSPLQGGGSGGGTVPPAPRHADSPHPNPSPEGEGLELATLAEQAARLCKADLVTEMVGEFPELQGIMGGYYAAAEGLDPQVAAAIRDHYKPVGQGDDVPTAPVTVAVSLADKLDTLFGFFSEGLLPTGSKDPFALRRAAIAYLRIVDACGVRMLISEAALAWGGREQVATGLQIQDFLHDRLGVMLRDVGVRYDVVQASTGLDTRVDGDVWQVRQRARALQAFIDTRDGTDLLAAYKRSANILKKENWGQLMAGPEDQGISQTGEEDPLVMVDDPLLADALAQFVPAPAPAPQAYAPGADEAPLVAALDAAEPAAAAAVADERFGDAMMALASLRAPIDAFFNGVMVNDPDPAIRAFRLGLLARFRDAVHTVADFSKIEG